MKKARLNDVEISYIILGNIKEGRYKKGEKIPSIRQLSKMFDSSHVTVAKAVKSLVDNGDLISVHGKGSYVADGFDEAQSESSKPGLVNFIPCNTRIKQIYFMLPSDNMIINEEQLETFNAAQEFGNEYGITFKQVLSNDKSWLSKIDPESTGVILNTSANLALLQSLGVPTVFYCLLSTLSCPSNSIMPNFNQGAQLLTEHLINKGHRRILFIDVDQRANFIKRAECADEFSTIERYYGYVQMMQEYGLEASLPVPWHYHNNADKVKAILDSISKKEKNTPTAMITASDMMAYEIIGIAKDLGIQIPNDLSIVSLNKTKYSIICDPQITTADFDQKTRGRLSVELLLGQTPAQSGFQTNLLLPMSLSERDSVKDINNSPG